VIDLIKNNWSVLPMGDKKTGIDFNDQNMGIKCPSSSSPV
jgi:hypothetical protein